MRIPSSTLSWRWMLLGVPAALLISFALFTFFRFYQVSGSSMQPSLQDHELVLLKRTFLERGALVIFSPPEEWRETSTSTEFLKRVAAAPGDEVSFTNNQLWINGEKVLTVEGRDCAAPFSVVLEDDFIALGDNTGNSRDSFFFWCEGKDPLIPLDNIKFVGERVL